MSWTGVSKPTGTPYTRINQGGREIYDDQNVLYDDSGVFYDGIDPLAWTNLAKPGGMEFLTAGMTMGLLMPLTISTTTTHADRWTDVNKPT
jgi:hypothetical protein